MTKEQHHFFARKMNVQAGTAKLHYSDRDAEIAERFNACAFTYNNHIFFNKNEYQPDTKKGKKAAGA